MRRIVPGVCLLVLLSRPAWPDSSSDYDIYWGDLHGHTMSEPVNLTEQIVRDYILHARDTMNLDFVALTEKDFDLNDTEWNIVRDQADELTDSGSFAAFSAFEWGDEGYDAFGHRPVLYISDSQPLFRSDVPTSDHVSELVESVANQTDGITIVAHPDLSNFSTDWDYFDSTTDRLAEIYSRHGHFEDGDEGIQQALALGYRFGFIGVSDTRSGTPGSDGLTAVLATSLSKSNLHGALEARRCYATTGARIGIWFAADGKPMGEEFSSASGASFAAEVTPTAGVDRIEIIKNNSVVYTWLPSSTAILPDREWRSKGDAYQLSPRKPGSGEPDPAVEELEYTAKDAKSNVVRQTYTSSYPENGVLKIDCDSDYQLYINDHLLVDTRTFEEKTPGHDCNAEDGHALAGSVQRFAEQGFFDLEALGVDWQAGENLVVLEYKRTAAGDEEEPRVIMQSSSSAPIEFNWADNNFTGPAFYYLRMTQTDGHEAWTSPIWIDRLAPDTTPPAAATKLRANKDENDVFLDWPKVTKDIDGNIESLDFYRVFRGTTYDFTPDRSGLTNQIATTTKSRYRDQSALLASEDYFYRVVAVDDDGNESVDLSNLAYKIHKPLTFQNGLSNIHWLSLPWEVIYSTASELADDLNHNNGTICTKVLRWDIGTQSPQSWVYMDQQWVGTDFNLTQGAAVGITISNDLDVVLVGAHDDGTALRLSPSPTQESINWISVPVGTPNVFASNLANEINEGTYPLIVSRVVRFAPNQIYQSYQWTGSIWSGTNFILMPGDAYAVEVETVYDWVPQTSP